MSKLSLAPPSFEVAVAGILKVKPDPKPPKKKVRKLLVKEATKP